MAKRVTELDTGAGRIVTGKAPKRAKAAELGTPRGDRRRDRVARALWG